MSDVSYYDLQAIKDELQRQIWDLERLLERAVDDLRQSHRDSAADIRSGLADLHDRLARLEDRTP